VPQKAITDMPIHKRMVEKLVEYLYHVYHATIKLE
jgi:hypothetical protein